MAATTIDRNTRTKAAKRRSFPMAAAALIPAGVMAAVNATGLLVNGATSTTLKCVGVTQGSYDNTNGAASAIAGETETGVFGPFVNSAAGDQVVLADVGSDCFIVDNQTVAKTNGGTTRSVAGKVWDVDASGVWVNFV